VWRAAAPRGGVSPVRLPAATYEGSSFRPAFETLAQLCYQFIAGARPEGGVPLHRPSRPSVE